MPDASAIGTRAAVVVRVERVHPGQTMIVRTLSETYGGLLAHINFVKGKWRSSYCDPETCCQGRVKDRRQWYGYAACQWWREDSRTWHPIALEITECLELDFREVYMRGQIWELFQPAKVKGKVFATTGRKLRQDDPETYPAAFSVQPALYSVYGVANVPLNVPNPHPKRLVLDQAEDAPPELPGVTLEDMERRRRQVEYYRQKQEEQKRLA